MSIAIDQGELVVAVSELEPLSPTVTRLSQLASGGNWSAAKIEESIALDQALTARVLSWQTRRPVPVRSRSSASEMPSCGSGSAVRKSVQPAIPEYELTEGELWRHSVASAFAVEVLASLVRAVAAP